MSYSYTERIEACIRTALRDFPRTFDEIVKKCYGAYPILVKQVMEEMKIHSRLVPLYFTQEEEIPYTEDAEVDSRKTELITYTLENNPILSNWYFSWQSCKKISLIDRWSGKNILFLGTPRLFEYFLIGKCAKNLTLIDLDKNVTDSLIKKYIYDGRNSHIKIQTDDINFLEYVGIKYDVIFLDPPWYLESYFTWITKASKLTAPTGTIIMSMFPSLVRPTATEERKELFKFCRKFSESVLSIPEYLEYDIPTFEQRELRHADIDLRSNWKISDLLILQGISPAEPNYIIDVGDEYKGWSEFNLFGFRWFIHMKKSDAVYENWQPLISLVGQSAYLDSPSRRNPQLKIANLRSSRGHGLFVSDPDRFLQIVNDFKSKCTNLTFESAINTLDIDDESKRNFKLMKDD